MGLCKAMRQSGKGIILWEIFEVESGKCTEVRSGLGKITVAIHIRPTYGSTAVHGPVKGSSAMGQRPKRGGYRVELNLLQ